MNSEIIKKMDEINKKRKDLREAISELKSLLSNESLENFYNKNNKDQYIYYLRNNDKKENSIHKYIDALEIIRKKLYEFVGLELSKEIYYIDNVDFFEYVLEKFNNSSDMVLLNLKHHHMYSAAINNYGKFLRIIK